MRTPSGQNVTQRSQALHTPQLRQALLSEWSDELVLEAIERRRSGADKQALALYLALAGANRIELGIQRGAQPITIVYELKEPPP